MFAPVTFRLIELAGRPTGVLATMVAEPDRSLLSAPSTNATVARRFAVCICQLSEVTSLLQVKSDPEGAATTCAQRR